MNVDNIHLAHGKHGKHRVRLTVGVVVASVITATACMGNPVAIAGVGCQAVVSLLWIWE
jgi:hypothetical protein